MIERTFHPVAELFPLMVGAEFESLKADIAENGLREAIWLHPDGRIIDGRNRYRACVESGIEPKYRTWTGEGSLVTFVVSLNLHRRHLTDTQKAVISVDILPMLEEEAKGRQGTRTDLQNHFPEKIPESGKGESRTQAASIVGTNERYVSDAKKIAQDAPEVFEMMRTGAVNMPAANQLAKLNDTERASVLSELKEQGTEAIGGRDVQKAIRSVHQQTKLSQPFPSDKYRVWYADPPWFYGNSGVINESDGYGHAERHYPTMTIEQLCEMGTKIKEQCEPDAVLFLWVTSPLLEECFPVIRTWGFKYKTSFIWDKVSHNFGHYNSVRHEILLVCTRGSCTPDAKELVDSVQSIEKSRKHSEKPEEFRAIIDKLYTFGKRVELFARSTVDGWDQWGNEA